MVVCYYGAMTAIDVLFQSQFFNTDHIFSFSLNSFDISVNYFFLTSVKKKCIDC